MTDEPFILPEHAPTELLVKLLPVLRVSKLAVMEPDNVALQATASEELDAVLHQIITRLRLTQAFTAAVTSIRKEAQAEQLGDYQA